MMYFIDLEKIMSLKNLPRTGWLLRNIPPSIAENVAEHSFEVALIAYVLAKNILGNNVKVNLGKTLTLALLHDASEAVTGDVVKWMKNKIGNLKEEAELAALKELSLDKERSLIKEYMNLNSLEGVIVRLADLIATVNQGCRYLKYGYAEVKDIILNNIESINTILSRIEDEKVRNILSNITSKILKCKG